MKRKVITFFIILISFLLQSTLFVKLKFGAVSPNLMLVVTSSFGFMRGRKSGIAVGAISGLLVDIFWGQLLGFHTLLYTVIGYLNGSFERLFYDEDIKLPIVLISASEFLYGICIYAAGRLCIWNIPVQYYYTGTCIHHTGNPDPLSGDPSY